MFDIGIADSLFSSLKLFQVVISNRWYTNSSEPNEAIDFFKVLTREHHGSGTILCPFSAAAKTGR
jgi:hypothetical protein